MGGLLELVDQPSSTKMLSYEKRKARKDGLGVWIGLMTLHDDDTRGGSKRLM